MRSWLKHQTFRQAVVSTPDQTISGTLVVEARDGVVLRSACLVLPEDVTVAIPGDVFIPRAKVSVIQFPSIDAA